MQEKHYEYAIDLLMAFLDIEKAYNSVRRSKVWNSLENRDVPKQTIGRVREIYNGSVSCVKVGEERSDWLEQKNGLRQGGALSPLLLIVVMDDIMTKVAQVIGEGKMKAMLFADDLGKQRGGSTGTAGCMGANSTRLWDEIQDK